MSDTFDFPARALNAIENLKQKGWTYSHRAGWLPPGCTGYQDSGKRRERRPVCICGYKNHEHTYSDANRPRGG